MITKIRIATIMLVASLFALAFTLWAPLTMTAQPMEPYAPDACVDGEQDSGAVYRICMPNNWDGKRLAVYTHGYVSPTEPIAIPENQLQGLDQLLNFLGYAFAMSSYSTNGLAVEEGIADTLDVIDVFAEIHGQPGEVIIVGVSEGGLIATLSLEQYPQVYRGGIAACGPIGGFAGQVNYLGDLRVLFDYFFPTVMPPTPVDIPQSLMDNWETGYYTDTVRPAITNPANAGKVTQLLATANAPYDADDEDASKEQTIRRLLWYNVYATNDGIQKLSGQPFENADRVYSGSDDDSALNDPATGAERFTADQSALDAIAAGYNPTGLLHTPLVTLHTDDDEVVPYWHVIRYGEKVEAQGSQAFYTHIGVENRYGHCQFETTEVLGALNALDNLINSTDPYAPPTIYLPIVSKQE